MTWALMAGEGGTTSTHLRFQVATDYVNKTSQNCKKAEEGRQSKHMEGRGKTVLQLVAASAGAVTEQEMAAPPATSSNHSYGGDVRSSPSEKMSTWPKLRLESEVKALFFYSLHKKPALAVGKVHVPFLLSRRTHFSTTSKPCRIHEAKHGLLLRSPFSLAFDRKDHDPQFITVVQIANNLKYDHHVKTYPLCR